MVMNTSGSASELMAVVGLKWLGGGSPKDGPTAGPEGTGSTQDAEGTREKNNVQKFRSKVTEALQDTNKKTSGYVRNTLGINIGIASILKQSQIFTGTLGTIFQILGALVDVILAPFLPIIVPAIKMMAENIPEIRKKAQEIVGAVVQVTVTIAQWIKWLVDLLPGRFGKIIKDIVQYWILGLFLAKLFGFHSQYMALTKGIFVLLRWGFQALIRGQTVQTATQQRGPASMFPVGPAGGGGPVVASGGRGMGSLRGLGGLGALTIGAGIAAGAAQGGVAGAGWAVGGAAVGGIAGGLLGSIVPVVGTAMGAMIGASIGSIAGPIIGASITGAFNREEGERANVDRYNSPGRNNPFNIQMSHRSSMRTT